MKSIVILIIMCSTIRVNAQFKQNVGLNGSYRSFNHLEQAINGALEYTVSNENFLFGVNIGRERWYNVGKLGDINYMQPSYSWKLEEWIGIQRNLFQSHFFLSANFGTRIYFRNQIKDSLCLSNENNFRIIGGSKNNIESLPLNVPGPNSYQQIRGKYSYVTAMPFAILTRMDFGYAFERFKIRAFIMPYWVRFHYENAADASIKGKTYNFFYDLGLGVNYTLPKKKKK